jgi:hypothetical protein
LLRKFLRYLGWQDVGTVLARENIRRRKRDLSSWASRKPAISRQDKELAMSKAGTIFALSVALSITSVGAEAFPGSPAGLKMRPPPVTLIRGFCGLGAHRGPQGYCVRNGAPQGYIAQPVIVAPPVVVVPRMVCPFPTHYDPGYGGCLI